MANQNPIEETQRLLASNSQLLSANYSATDATERSVKQYHNQPPAGLMNDAGSQRTPITMTWNSIQLTLSVSTGPPWKRHTESKRVLSDVSGIVKPGQLLAIVGPSGAGKSSLLDVLSGRKNTGTVQGTVLVNGLAPDRDFKRRTGYVTQDDCLMGNLTVRETFRFHAALKMPRGTTAEQREQRIQAVLDELALTRVADQYVGTQFRRGVSGGEKKRVSIGCELLTDPALLFLDEPTSGLDAFNSLSVLKTLRRLAERGRTVICTIHQPRSSIYELFDQLMVLSLGRTVYFGPAAQVTPYFDHLGYHCPQYSNPADFLIDTVVRNEKATFALQKAPRLVEQDDNTNIYFPPQVSTAPYLVDQDDDDDDDANSLLKHTEASLHLTPQSPLPSTPPLVLADQFASSPIAASLMQEISEANSHAALGAFPPRSRFPTSWFHQLGWLIWRTVLNYYRNPMVTYIQLFQTIFFSLLIGLIYLQMSDTLTSLQDRLGAIFFMMTNQCFGNFGALASFFDERSIYQREQQAGVYYTSAYFLAKTVIEGPTVLLFPVVFGSISYWMIGLTPTADAFLIFLAALMTFSAVATSLFLLLGAISPNQVVAQILAPLFIVLMLLFGGFYVNNDNVPVYFEWLKYWSFFYWGYGILVWNELHDFNNGKGFLGFCNCTLSQSCPCCNDITVPTNTSTCDYYVSGKEELRLLGLQNTEIWQNFAILLGMIVGYRILCYFALRYLHKEKR